MTAVLVNYRTHNLANGEWLLPARIGLVIKYLMISVNCAELIKKVLWGCCACVGFVFELLAIFLSSLFINSL